MKILRSAAAGTAIVLFGLSCTVLDTSGFCLSPDGEPLGGFDGVSELRCAELCESRFGEPGVCRFEPFELNESVTGPGI